MESSPTTRVAARIAAVAAAIVAIVGLVLVFGARPDDGGLRGIGTAVETLIGGALLVTAALFGLTSALLWLVAARRERRLR